MPLKIKIKCSNCGYQESQLVETSLNCDNLICNSCRKINSLSIISAEEQEARGRFCCFLKG